MDIIEFVKYVIENKIDVTDGYYYVCNFVPNKNNLLKKVSSNLKPTKIKFKSNIDELNSYDSLSYQIESKLVVVKGEKELSKRLDVYNQNSGTFLHIFRDKYDCLDYYITQQNKYIGQVEAVLTEIKNSYLDIQNKLQKEVDKL